MAKKADSKKKKVKVAAKKNIKATTKTGGVKKSAPKAAKKSAPKPVVKKTAVSKSAPVKSKAVKTSKVLKSKVVKTETKKKVRKSPAARDVEVHAPVKFAPKIKGYSKKELDEFKFVIMEKREEIIEQLQNLKDQMMDPSTGEYVNESSPYSLHMADQGTEAQEREKLYLWAQRENKFLGYLEESLQRIENGTYGICIECMDEPKNLCQTCPLVPKERLIAVPHTQLCVQLKMAQKK
ncbi:MAG: conjugal transfer protein TraR [Bacteroidetes bacterium]|nr:conjugal transfer protein TraR [Bacteroidota bacterium]MBU1680930.1 conjugal transfer protein TraR [Bacteroidota bacterium]MBU2505636.1 conjugal transfer protein TraR [Bacteroidota bacterium]